MMHNSFIYHTRGINLYGTRFAHTFHSFPNLPFNMLSSVCVLGIITVVLGKKTKEETVIQVSARALETADVSGFLIADTTTLRVQPSEVKRVRLRPARATNPPP